MPFNNGTFSKLYDWIGNKTDIPRKRGDRLNQEFENFSDGLTEVQTQIDAKAATSQVREKLTANRTYYVRTDGSDSNDGLSNTSGGAFLTIGKAVSVMQELDAGIYNVTISVADGTYAENVTVNGPLIGTGTFKIQGNTTTPANVVVNRIWAQNGAIITVDGFRLTSTSGLRALNNGTKLTIDNVSLSGAVAMSAEVGGLIHGVNADINIESTVSTSIAQATNGVIDLFGASITVDGNAWSAAGAFYVISVSYVRLQGVTFTGSATGKRYAVSQNSVLHTAGGGASFIPGDVAGTTASGGQYT